MPIGHPTTNGVSLKSAQKAEAGQESAGAGAVACSHGSSGMSKHWCAMILHLVASVIIRGRLQIRYNLGSHNKPQ